ncbi:MAG: hypothetical protein HYW49_02935 [Deltaproteobacteria bacterium]|nr:hypothetical protein [Deltaproteobacteria bacterium]
MRFRSLTFALLAAILQVSPAAAGSLKSDLAQTGLAAVLTYRCEEWFGASFAECSKTAFAQVAALDQRNDGADGSLIFFHDDFKTLAASKEIGSYLEEIESGLGALTKDASARFDLFARTTDFLRHRGEKNPIESARWLIAVLFQDNAKELHMKWIENHEPTLMSAATLVRYKRIMELIRDAKGREQFLDRIDFYPESVRGETAHFNRKIYYYYMPWLLARKLKTLGEISSVMPLAMSVIYKYLHHYHSYWDAVTNEPIPTGMFDRAGNYTPLHEDAFHRPDFSWLYRYRDLYMAYLGSHAVTRRARHLSFPVFQKYIAEQPVALLKFIYSNPPVHTRDTARQTISNVSGDLFLCSLFSDLRSFRAVVEHQLARNVPVTGERIQGCRHLKAQHSRQESLDGHFIDEVQRALSGPFPFQNGNVT